MSVRALLIGCGNIGARYDWDSDDIRSWAKALANDDTLEFDVFDIDQDWAEKVAARYGARSLASLGDASLSDYDFAVVATPTHNHHEMLASLLRNGPELLVCEKPVASEAAHLTELEAAYNSSGRRVIVNFHRRFLPVFASLQDTVQGLLSDQKCTSIAITYQRGFHNNASHAVDLLEFLFERTLQLEGAQIAAVSADAFPNDPTLSAYCDWDGTHVTFVGLPDLQASVFEIAFYFERNAIFIKNGGDRVEHYSAPGATQGFYPALRIDRHESGAMRNYMLSVLSHVKKLLSDEKERDNFQRSVDLSRRILGLQKAT